MLIKFSTQKKTKVLKLKIWFWLSCAKPSTAWASPYLTLGVFSKGQHWWGLWSGFWKSCGLFSSVEIARINGFWKLGIYRHPFCSPKVWNSKSSLEGVQNSTRMTIHTDFLQFSPAPTFWTQPINHEKKLGLVILSSKILWFYHN